MLFSHTFASPANLDRARFWLTWHGFTVHEVQPTETAKSARPRLLVRGSLGTSAAAHALIDSIEHNNPDAWPGLAPAAASRWVVDQPQPGTVAGTSTPHGTPIHWDSRDARGGDTTASRVAEYMFSRWE